MCFFSVIPENLAWGNAKDGQILFGTGKTYALDSEGNIGPISAIYNSGKISSSELWDKDKARVETLTSTIREALMTLDVPAQPVAGNGDPGDPAGEEENDEQE